MNKQTSSLLAITAFSFASLFASGTSLAAAYEQQDSDYGHKTINIVKYESRTKVYGAGKPYQEAYITYTEKSGGTERVAACGSDICDKFLKNPSKFNSLYAGKRASVKTDERTANDDKTMEEIILELKIKK